MSNETLNKLLNGNRWYKGTYEIFEQGNFPIDCPWKFEPSHSLETFIEEIFNPVAAQLPKTVAFLKSHCQRVLALNDSGHWFLIYEMDINDLFLCGAEPTQTPHLRPEAVADGWEMPEELARLYAVHNGFGPLFKLGMFWNYDAVLPDNELETLYSLFVKIKEADVKLPYNLKDLLGFFPDGMGNGQYFYREGQAKHTQRIVDWDHETREISDEYDFWEFIDAKLSRPEQF